MLYSSIKIGNTINEVQRFIFGGYSMNVTTGLKSAAFSALILVPGLANASTTVVATCGSGIGNYDQQSQTSQSGGLVSTTCNSSGALIQNRSDNEAGAASANYGVLKGSTKASGINSTGGTNTISTFSDTLVIDSSGNAGKVGQASISMFFTYVGTLSAGFGGNAGIGYDLSFLKSDGFSNDLSQNAFTRIQNNDSNGISENLTYISVTDGIPVPFGNPLTANFSFIFGSPFTITSTLKTFASIGYGDTSNASMDASNSAYWDGFNGVSLNGGQVNFNITSNSGTDWSKSFVPKVSAVPEPATWAMMIVGFGLVGGVMRRRRSVRVTYA